MNDELLEQISDLDSLAISNPVKYASEKHANRDWVLSADDVARVRPVNPDWFKEDRAGFFGKVGRGLSEAGSAMLDVPQEVKNLINSGGVALQDLVSPNMTESQMRTRLQTGFREMASIRANRQKQLELDELADSDIVNWSNMIGQVGLYALLGLGTGSAGVIGALSGAQAAGEINQSFMESYAEQSGDTTLQEYTPGIDPLIATSYGALAGWIESKLGVERLATGALTRLAREGEFRALRQGLSSAVGEGAEESLQEFTGYIAGRMAGYDDRSETAAIKDALTAGLYGAILGGPTGAGLYYVNRARMINWFENRGLSHEQATSAANQVYDEAIADTMNEISANDSLRNYSGTEFNNLVDKVQSALVAAGWEQNNPGRSVADYARVVSADVANQVLRISGKSNLTTNEILNLGEIETDGNIVWLRPQNLQTVEQVQAKIDEIDERIKGINAELKQARADRQILQEDKEKSRQLRANLQEQRLKLAVLNRLLAKRRGDAVVERAELNRQKAELDRRAIQATNQDLANVIDSLRVAGADEDFVYVGNRRLPVNYRVVDMGQVRQSHIGGVVNKYYGIKELQNRASRGTSADDAVLRQRAQDFKPEFMVDSPNTQYGAPVVNKNGDVIAGNGRVETLRYVYEDNQAGADAYKERLQSMGFDVADMERPILVRETADDLTTEQQIAIADASNVSEISAFDHASQAIQDSKLLQGTNGAIEWAQKLPITERQRLFLNNGKWDLRALNQRYNDALLAWMCNDDPRLFERIILSGKVSDKIISGLTQTGASIVSFQTAHPELDLRGDINSALVKASSLRNKNEFMEFVSTPDLSGVNEFPANSLLYNMVFSNTSGDINNFISAYMAKQETNTQGDNLLGEQVRFTKDDIYSQTLKQTYPDAWDGDTITNKNLLAVFMSQQNQYAGAEQPSQLMQEQFDLANENARLDDIYPEYKGETIDIFDYDTTSVSDWADKNIEKQDSFETDEGVFTNYKLVGDNRKMPTFTVFESKDGWIVRNAHIPESEQNKGIGTKFYQYINLKSIEKTGKPLRSTQLRKLSSGIEVFELSYLGHKLWDSLTKKGLAVKNKNGTYEFKKPQERTVYNSNGDRIAKSAEALRNFWNWFGDSKVVDRKGRPVVMYHGTNAKFDTFNKEYLGGTDYGFYGSGFYFHPMKKFAKTYGKNVLSVYLKADKIFDFSGFTFNSDKQLQLLDDLGVLDENDSKTVKKYIDFYNKFESSVKTYKTTYEYEGKTYDRWHAEYNGMEHDTGYLLNPTEEIVKQQLITKYNLLPEIESNLMKKYSGDMSKALQKQGYDGIIAGMEYIVFEPNQIKSTENRGTFSPDTGNIYQQGRIQNGFYDSELQVIVLGRNFNTTTLPHEMSHFWLNTYFKLFKQAQKGQIQVSEQWLTEVKTLFNMLGINENQENLTRVQQERWAALNEGVITGYAGIPSDCALPITEYLNWIPEKYKSILQIGYLDENGNIQRPVLDKAGVDFFNEWYGNITLPSLPTSPAQESMTNRRNGQGEIVPATAQTIKDRENTMETALKEQKQADDELYKSVDESVPQPEKNAITAQVAKYYVPEQEQLPEHESWFRPGRRTNTVKEMERVADKYVKQNPDKAREIALSNPLTTENDSGVDRESLIRAVMKADKIEKGTDLYTIYENNIALSRSRAGTELGLSSRRGSYQMYLDAYREMSIAMEKRAAYKYAGRGADSVDKLNTDILELVNRYADRIFGDEKLDMQIAIAEMCAEADVKFAGNEDSTVFNQLDLTNLRTVRTKRAFVAYAEHLIRKDIVKAEPDTTMQGRLLEGAERAEKAAIDINSDDKVVAAAGMKVLREWTNLVRSEDVDSTAWSKFINSYAPRAMLSGISTHATNVFSGTFEQPMIRAAIGAYYGKNIVPDDVISQESDRIKFVYKNTLMNLTTMVSSQDPSLIHGEKYKPLDPDAKVWVKVYDAPMRALGAEDNLFRIPTYLDVAARMASRDSGGDVNKAIQLFKEYTRTQNKKVNGQENPYYAKRQEIINVAAMSVFTQNGKLAGALNKMRDALNNLTVSGRQIELGTAIAPFVKTPANIFASGMRAPFGAMRALYRKITGQPLDIQDAVDVAHSIGLLLIGLVAGLLMDYEPPYTGGKYDPNKPYDSIGIGGMWLKIDTLGVLETPLRLLLSTIHGELPKSVKGTVENIPLVGELVGANLDYLGNAPDRYISGLLYNQANKLIPTIARQVVKPIGHATVEDSVELSDWDALGWAGVQTGIGRKIERSYGLDGGDLSFNDLVGVVWNRLKYYPN